MNKSTVGEKAIRRLTRFVKSSDPGASQIKELTAIGYRLGWIAGRAAAVKEQHLRLRPTRLTRPILPAFSFTCDSDLECPRCRNLIPANQQHGHAAESAKASEEKPA